jgi:hypothetical protein
MRKVSVALSTLAALVIAVAVMPQALAQKADTPGATAPPDVGALEKPGPRIEPKSTGKPGQVTGKKGRVGGVTAPKGDQTADVRRTAALDEVREVQTQPLGKFSMRRQKVMRIDNLPKSPVRPIAVIYGPLGPYGYQSRYLSGQTGAKSASAKKSQGNTPGSGLGGPAGAKGLGRRSGRAGERGGSAGSQAGAFRAGGAGKTGRRY